jgi:hypothetical protein
MIFVSQYSFFFFCGQPIEGDWEISVSTTCCRNLYSRNHFFRSGRRWWSLISEKTETRRHFEPWKAVPRISRAKFSDRTSFSCLLMYLSSVKSLALRRTYVPWMVRVTDFLLGSHSANLASSVVKVMFFWNHIYKVSDIRAWGIWGYAVIYRSNSGSMSSIPEWVYIRVFLGSL